MMKSISPSVFTSNFLHFVNRRCIILFELVSIGVDGDLGGVAAQGPHRAVGVVPVHTDGHPLEGQALLSLGCFR